MRYSVPADVTHEEATPRGLVTFHFPEGEHEPEDDSDERFILEHRLIPDGLARRVREPDVILAVAEPETDEEN